MVTARRCPVIEIIRPDAARWCPDYAGDIDPVLLDGTGSAATQWVIRQARNPTRLCPHPCGGNRHIRLWPRQAVPQNRGLAPKPAVGAVKRSMISPSVKISSGITASFRMIVCNKGRRVHVHVEHQPICIAMCPILERPYTPSPRR